MKTKEISYRRVFSLGDYQTETYGVTIEMIESTDVQEAIELARTTIEEAHAKVMSERAKPERVEKLQSRSYSEGKVHLTEKNCETILKAIRAGKASREYVDNNFTFDAYAKREVERTFNELNIK